MPTKCILISLQKLQFSSLISDQTFSVCTNVISAYIFEASGSSFNLKLGSGESNWPLLNWPKSGVSILLCGSLFKTFQISVHKAYTVRGEICWYVVIPL